MSIIDSFSFQQAQNRQFKNMVYDQYEEIDSGHGRIETRKCTVLPLMYLHQFKLKWQGLQSLVLIERRREVNDQIQMEQRYYISSLPMKAHLLMTSIRQHWGIESAPQAHEKEVYVEHIRGWDGLLR